MTTNGKLGSGGLAVETTVQSPTGLALKKSARVWNTWGWRVALSFLIMAVAAAGLAYSFSTRILGAPHVPFDFAACLFLAQISGYYLFTGVGKWLRLRAAD